ncbi:MAG: PAS domain S-box protein [Chloroflexales bacterium]|nr:PAS domain S-box protein [Chloroflexales bacterium]
MTDPPTPVPVPPDATPDGLRARIVALEARLADLEGLLEHFPGVIARFDRLHRHLFVSASVTRATGLAAARFLGKMNQELGMPPDLVAQWDRALADVFATGQAAQTQFAFSAAGDVHFYDAELVPEVAPDDSVATVLAVTRDVTDRVHAEQAIAASEQRYRALFEQSLDGIALISEQGQLLQVNEALTRMLGRSREQLLTMRLTDLEGAATSIESGPSAVRREAEPRAVTGEWQLRRPDGGHCMVEYALQPLAPNLTQLTMHDLTRRRDLELALRASAERLELILRHLPIAFFAQDADLRYTWAANIQMGLPSEQVLGKTDAEIFPAERAEVLTALKRGVLQQGRGAHAEHRLRHHEDETIYDLTIEPLYDLTIEPLHDRDGTVTGLLGVVLDITARTCRISRNLRRESPQIGRKPAEIGVLGQRSPHRDRPRLT